MNDVILPTAKDIHCLKRLSKKQMTQVPFSFGEDMQGYTCMCGSGWFSASGGSDGPTEAYRAHVGF